MSLDEVIFIDSYPSIDLHGYDRDSARVAVKDFVKENIKLRNQIIVIIHGIGQGIVKKSVHDYLKNNKYVISYKLFPYNIGCTIVNLDIER